MQNGFFLNPEECKTGTFLRGVEKPLFFCTYVKLLQMLVN